MEKREIDSCGEERNRQLWGREKWTVVGKKEMDTHEERNRQLWRREKWTVVGKREMDTHEERNR